MINKLSEQTQIINKSKQDICKLSDENLNLKSRLAELEVKILSEDLSNNTISFKESIDAVVIIEVNLSSISATSIPLDCISQIASSNEVNHNHSMGADNFSPYISQPVVINNVVFPITANPAFQ